MTRIGYFLACEECGPKSLLEPAGMAEEAGFEGFWVPDHYHPWTSAQGNSPSVWSVIGGLSQAASLPVTTSVTCPTVRIHPVVLAQAGLKACWNEDAVEARKTASRLWANEQLPGELAQELPEVAHFEQATSVVTEDVVAGAFPCGPDPESYRHAVQRYVDAGYDEVYVQQIGGNFEGFFGFFEEEVLPEFRQG